MADANYSNNQVPTFDVIIDQGEVKARLPKDLKNRDKVYCVAIDEKMRAELKDSVHLMDFEDFDLVFADQAAKVTAGDYAIIYLEGKLDHGILEKLPKSFISGKGKTFSYPNNEVDGDYVTLGYKKIKKIHKVIGKASLRAQEVEVTL